MLYPQVIGEPVGEPEDIKEVFGSPEQFPLYTITTHVKRLHQFYLWNYVLYMVHMPNILLVVYMVLRLIADAHL